MRRPSTTTLGFPLKRLWQHEPSRLTAGVALLDLLMFPTDLRLGKDYPQRLCQLLEEVEIDYLAPMHLNGKSPA